MNNFNYYNNRNLLQIGEKIKRLVVMVLILFLTMSSLTKVAATSVTTASQSHINVTIDYLEEMAYITPGIGGSTKFYLSLDKMKTWMIIEPHNMLDISTLLKTKEVTLYFKGNKDINPLMVLLQPIKSSLQVAYEIQQGEGRVTFNTTVPLEYRKGSYGQWKPVVSPMITAPYETNGATLYFRTMASSINRAGRTVSLKIPKKPSAPSVKLDGSKLYITGLKSGVTQYRIGDSTIWSDFEPEDKKIKVLNLRGLFAPTLTPIDPIPGGTIEFRTKPTDKKVASSVKILEIPNQATVPTGIQLNGTTLTIQDTNLKRAYEHTIVKSTDLINLSTARWYSATAAKPVLIKKAVVGDRILVRLKSITDPDTKQVIPASTYREMVVTSVSMH